jgi:hypothetical protein
MTSNRFEDSLVLTMLQKALDKDVPVNIAIQMTPHKRAFGQITRAQFWISENIINIEFVEEADADETVPRRREFRFRPLTMKDFDSRYSLRKVDGVLTLVRREEELAEGHDIVFNDKELTMSGQLVLRTITRWLERGEQVHIDYVTGSNVLGRGIVRSMKLRGDAYQFIQEDTNMAGWETSIHVTHRDFNVMGLSTGELQGKKTLFINRRIDALE